MRAKGKRGRAALRRQTMPPDPFVPPTYNVPSPMTISLKQKLGIMRFYNIVVGCAYRTIAGIACYGKSI